MAAAGHFYSAAIAHTKASASGNDTLHRDVWAPFAVSRGSSLALGFGSPEMAGTRYTVHGNRGLGIGDWRRGEARAGLVLYRCACNITVAATDDIDVMIMVSWIAIMIAIFWAACFGIHVDIDRVLYPCHARARAWDVRWRGVIGCVGKKKPEPGDGDGVYGIGICIGVTGLLKWNLNLY